MFISSNTGDSYQKAGQLLYLPFPLAQTLVVQVGKGFFICFGSSTEREPQEQQQQQQKLRSFPYSILLQEGTVNSVISRPWAPTVMQPVGVRTAPLQISFHAVLQAPSVPAARFNRSHDSLLGPGRKGFKMLLRAAFYTVSKPVPRELLLLGTCSSLPPRSLKWWACHSQGVSVKSTGQWGRQRNELQRFVSSRFPSQRQGHTEATLWLGMACSLPRQPICHLAHSHTIHYWTLLQQQSDLIMQLEQLL